MKTSVINPIVWILLFGGMISFSYTGCKHRKNTVGSNQEQHLSTTEDVPAVQYRVQGLVMVRKPYCGGAAPSEEIKKKFGPEPGHNLVFWVQSQSTDSTKSTFEPVSMRTDTSGIFSFELPSGSYCLKLDERTHKLNPRLLAESKLEFDPECQAEYESGCDLRFEVKDQSLELPPVMLVKKCNNPYFSPCVRYTGPIAR
jgi:hypothetical protein